MDKDSAIYEVGFHISPTVGEAELPVEVNKIKESLSEVGAEIISEEFPEMKSLAYPLAGKTSAYFGWIKFECEKNSIQSLEKALKANSVIIRFLLVKTVKENTLQYSKLAAKSKRAANYESETVESELTPNVETPVPVKEVKEEEMDKSIDELVIN